MSAKDDGGWTKLRHAVPTARPSKPGSAKRLRLLRLTPDSERTEAMALTRSLFVFACLLWASTHGLAYPKTKAVVGIKTRCQRYHALKRFSACGTSVGHAVREKSLLENPNQNETCQKAQGFEKCFQDSMRLTRCVRSSEFNFHLQHISSLVNEMYKESCSSSGETSSVLTDMSTVCDIRVAVVRFLECTSSYYLGEQLSAVAQNQTHLGAATNASVQFGVMFNAPGVGGVMDKYNRISPIECRRNAKFKNCIENIHLYSECGIGTEVHSHLKYLANIVTRKFARKCSHQSQLAELDCQLLPFLRKFLRCGVNRYEAPGDRVDQDACTQVLSYKECVQAAERVTHCNMRNLSLSYHLTYLDNVMTSVNASCSAVRNMETSVYKESCKRTTLFNNYFSCGMEVQARLEGLNKGDKERCRISENFEKCFINAKEQSGCLLADEATSIMSALLDTWKKEHAKECSDLNVPPSKGSQAECLTGTAVRKVFLCGLNFQTAVREVKYSPMEMSPEVCRRLEEMNSCIAEVKSHTRCAMSELHAHVAPLLQPFTIDYAERCERVASSNQSAPMLPSSAPACRRLPALKRIFHCGLSFSRILEEMELVHQKAEVLCPLLKKYETCVPDSATELGCRDDPVMKGHVRSFGKILHRQYYEACIKNRRARAVLRTERLRRVSGIHENISRDILGNVKVMKQELWRGLNATPNVNQQILGQVMEDYYGPDYDEYVEEEDKVPDSLDVKPAYDYPDRAATQKPKKQEAEKSAQSAKEVMTSNKPETQTKQEEHLEQKKSQEFWAGVERARKIRSQHRYEPGSLELLQDFSNNHGNLDFARPGTYFIDQLSNPDPDADPYARRDPHSDDEISDLAGGVPGHLKNSEANWPVYTSLRNVPRAARQGERGVGTYDLRRGPPMTREEELEMYEDTRGMAELLRKQRKRHYGLYKGGDKVGLKSDMRRVEKDVAHSYALGDEGPPPGYNRARSSFNKSRSYLDYHDDPSDNMPFRSQYGMRRIERYPYRAAYAANEIVGNDGTVPRPERRVIGLQRRGRAFRGSDYLTEYGKPHPAHLSHTGGEDEIGSRDVIFPDDDGPALSDQPFGQEALPPSYRKAMPMRRRERKVFVDASQDLEAGGGTGDINYRHGGMVALSDGLNGEKAPGAEVMDTFVDEKEPSLPQYNRQEDGLQYYPRRLASNKFRLRTGLPNEPRSAVGIRQGDFSMGSRDYKKVPSKISEETSALEDEEGPLSGGSVKRLDAHDRIMPLKNSNYYHQGESSQNIRSFQRKTQFKRPAYKELEPHGMDSYPDELRPFQESPRRHANDSTYVGPNSFLPEPGLRSPKEKVLPDFLGETKPRAMGPEPRSRKDGSPQERSAHPPGSHVGNAESSRNFEEGRGSHSESFVQQAANPQKRFFDVKKRGYEPRLGFPYLRHINNAPGLLLEKKDEASGGAIAKPQNNHRQLSQYEAERRQKKKLMRDDLDEFVSNHKEEIDSKADMMLFPSDRVGHDDRVVRDFDAKALQDSKDYSELDTKLESDGGDRSSMWSAIGDNTKEELLRKHLEGAEKKLESPMGELSRRNAWYTDDIWSDSNDLFGMERLLSDQRREIAANVTDEDEMAQCQLHNLQKRTDACARVFEDDFKAIGNGTVRQFSGHPLTPQLRKSVCSHVRDFHQCVNLFAQKYRCVDSHELIGNLTERHLQEAGVMFCCSSSACVCIKLVLTALLLHVLRH